MLFFLKFFLFLQGVFIFHEFYAGLLKELKPQACAVFSFEYHLFDPGLNNMYAAEDAGLGCHVDGGSVTACAPFCALVNGVGFRVSRPAEFKPLSRGDPLFLPYTVAQVRAMNGSGGSSVIAGGYYLLFSYYDGPDLS